MDLLCRWRGGAVAVRTLRQDGLLTTRYLIHDHLGSATIQTNESGDDVCETAYDAFCNARDPVTGQSITQDCAGNGKGYTDQMSMAGLGLVHANGRIYDPALGRFLSVDPVFQFETNTQSLNPYSYVLNNPLSLTDPSGYEVTCGKNDENCTEAISKLKPGESTTQKVTTTEIGSHISSHRDVTITKTLGGHVALSLGNGAKLTQKDMDHIDQRAATSDKGVFTFAQNVDVQKNPNADLTPLMGDLLHQSNSIGQEGSDGWISGGAKGLVDNGLDTLWHLSEFGQFFGGNLTIFGGSNSNDGQLAYDMAPALMMITPAGDDVGALKLESLFEGGAPKASRLAEWAEAQGWTRSKTPTGPIKYLDENGVPRITLKQGSARVPGSEFPHVEIRNASGQRTNPAGEPVKRKSDENHLPIEYDLPPR